MSATDSIPSIIKETRTSASGNPPEAVEPRQVTTTDDMHPDPSKSIKLPPNRQALLDDVIALYSCEPTIERVCRYAPNCVYDDQFVYANNRYKMAGQWFALPKLFPGSKNEGYEVIKNEPTLIQFKNEQTWTMPVLHNKVTINALVSLELDPATADSDFPTILYHKDMANEKDYSHEGEISNSARGDISAHLLFLMFVLDEGFGFAFKKSQADIVSRIMSDENVKYFKGDDLPDRPVEKHGSGKNAPVRDL